MDGRGAWEGGALAATAAARIGWTDARDAWGQGEHDDRDHQQPQQQQVAKPRQRDVRKTRSDAPQQDDSARAIGSGGGGTVAAGGDGGKAASGGGLRCTECQRGRPLKLFKDDDDGNVYCRMCWFQFYEMEPPRKPS